MASEAIAKAIRALSPPPQPGQDENRNRWMKAMLDAADACHPPQMGLDWQPAATAPKDTSYFAVLTILGDIEGWIYEPEPRYFRVWAVPGFAERIVQTTATIRGWTRWNKVLDYVKGAPQPVRPNAEGGDIAPGDGRCWAKLF